MVFLNGFVCRQFFRVTTHEEQDNEEQILRHSALLVARSKYLMRQTCKGQFGSVEH